MWGGVKVVDTLSREMCIFMERKNLGLWIQDSQVSIQQYIPFVKARHVVYEPADPSPAISLLIPSTRFKGRTGGSVGYKHHCRYRLGLGGGSVNRQETRSLERLISGVFLPDPPAFQTPQRSV
jgi:hypothetical protein